MKLSINLDENAPPFELSNDHIPAFFFCWLKHEIADLVLNQNYTHTQSSRSLGVG
jgi:hypothetical protein